MTRPIWSSGRREDRFSQDFFPAFSAGGHCKQFWYGQGCSLFDVVRPAFSLPTTASPTLQGALKADFGEAVSAWHARTSPSSIFLADHGVAHPPRCPEGWLWRGCKRVTCPNHATFLTRAELITMARDFTPFTDLRPTFKVEQSCSRCLACGLECEI